MCDSEAPVERLTPEAFKAEYRRRGWTGKALAKRWNRSEVWISLVGSDPKRDQYWDDAVRGLPIIQKKKNIKV